MSKDGSFGYECKNGEPVINEKNQAIVKWIYKKTIEYMDNPPNYLIKEVIDHSKKKFSVQEVREKVSLHKIEIYVLAELKIRILQLEKQQEGFIDIQKAMEMPLNEALQAAVEERYRL